MATTPKLYDPTSEDHVDRFGMSLPSIRLDWEGACMECPDDEWERVKSFLARLEVRATQDRIAQDLGVHPLVSGYQALMFYAYRLSDSLGSAVRVVDAMERGDSVSSDIRWDIEEAREIVGIFESMFRQLKD